MRRSISGLLILMILFTFFINVKADLPEEQIDEIIEDVMNIAKVPGVSVSVTNDHEIIFEKGYGVESLSTNKPMTENSLSAIGSLTKSFTTLAILQQVEKGKIDLDDPVIKYIPEFKTFDDEKSREITIRMLLTNTSGLHHNVSFDFFTRDSENVDYMEAIKKNETVELLFDPGTSYGYSNEGFVIAGRILEIVTGMSYTKYLDEYIFKPLEMDLTTSDIDRIKSEDALYGHLGGIDSFIPAKKRHVGLMIPAGSETRSTAHELSHYIQMLMNEGRYKDKTLLGEKLFNETLAKPAARFTMFGEELKYGYGWMHIEEYGLQFHGGQTLSMSAMVMWDKENKIGVSVLYNVSDVKQGTGSNIMKIAADILSLYTQKNYPKTGAKEEPLNTEQQRPLDDKFYKEYISEDGYTRLVIENREDSIARFIGTGGVTEYKLSLLSDTTLLAENVSSESLFEAKRGRNKEILYINHPMIGKFVPDVSIKLKEYRDGKWNGLSFIYPPGTEFTVTPETCQLKAEGVMLNIMELDQYNEFIEYKGQEELIEETGIRVAFINGKKITEKIQVYDKNGALFSRVLVKIEGEKSIGVLGEIPFDKLTFVRLRIIKPLIKSLKAG